MTDHFDARQRELIRDTVKPRRFDSPEFADLYEELEEWCREAERRENSPDLHALRDTCPRCEAPLASEMTFSPDEPVVRAVASCMWCSWKTRAVWDGEADPPGWEYGV